MNNKRTYQSLHRSQAVMCGKFQGNSLWVENLFVGCYRRQKFDWVCCNEAKFWRWGGVFSSVCQCVCQSHWWFSEMESDSCQEGSGPSALLHGKSKEEKESTVTVWHCLVPRGQTHRPENLGLVEHCKHVCEQLWILLKLMTNCREEFRAVCWRESAATIWYMFRSAAVL